MNSSTPSLLTELLTAWNVSPASRLRLRKYYVLHWSYEYFKNYKEQHFGIIQHQEKDYLTVYHKCTPLSLSLYPEIKISLRLQAGSMYTYGYALITPKIDLELP